MFGRLCVILSMVLITTKYISAMPVFISHSLFPGSAGPLGVYSIIDNVDVDKRDKRSLYALYKKVSEALKHRGYGTEWIKL